MINSDVFVVVVFFAQIRFYLIFAAYLFLNYYLLLYILGFGNRGCSWFPVYNGQKTRLVFIPVVSEL